MFLIINHGQDGDLIFLKSCSFPGNLYVTHLELLHIFLCWVGMLVLYLSHIDAIYIYTLLAAILREARRVFFFFVSFDRMTKKIMGTKVGGTRMNSLKLVLEAFQAAKNCELIHSQILK